MKRRDRKRRPSVIARLKEWRRRMMGRGATRPQTPFRFTASTDPSKTAIQQLANRMTNHQATNWSRAGFPQDVDEVKRIMFEPGYAQQAIARHREKVA